MKKRKKKPRELTQYQLERREYNAFADQAYWRQYLAKHGLDMAWEDPTRGWSDEEA